MNKLEKIAVGSGSFMSGEIFDIENMNSLEDIELGERIFDGSEGSDEESSLFCIKNSPLLKRVIIKEGSFMKTRSLVLEGMK